MGGTPTKFGRVRWTIFGRVARNWSKNAKGCMSASSVRVSGAAERISASNAGSVSVTRVHMEHARGGGRC